MNAAILKRWSPFAVASLMSIVAYKTLWASSVYMQILSGLAVLSLLLGLYALRAAGFRPVPVMIFAAGLVVGQWWLVAMAITFAFWKFKGFAP
jgi:hypothetical protein